MKLSKNTITICKNFATINSNLTIKEGSKIVTRSAGKNIIAEATVEENFPSEFGIYDLNEFLGVLSLFDSPELDFSEKSVTIKEGKNKVTYFAASPSILTPVPNMKEFPDADVEFELSSNMLSHIQKVSSILKVTDFSVIGDGTNVFIQVGDKANSTSNTFKAEIGETDKTFQINFKVDNLKMLPGDYIVAVGGKKISRFSAKHNQDQALVYYIAIEFDSTFGD